MSKKDLKVSMPMWRTSFSGTFVLDLTRVKPNTTCTYLRKETSPTRVLDFIAEFEVVSLALTKKVTGGFFRELPTSTTLFGKRHQIGHESSQSIRLVGKAMRNILL